MNKLQSYSACSQRGLVAALILSTAVCTTAHAQQAMKWGLTLANINNPIPPVVVTNADGSVSITAGGGDTYSAPDSFTYAYQQVTGDFDICVQVVNVTGNDETQDSQKGALMVRSSLEPETYDFQVNAMPLAPFGRDGEIESIGRLDLDRDTDDVPGRMQKYGGDCTDAGYATYPDCWLRIQRQGDKLMSYFATTNTTDFPTGWASNPGSTNGWQLLTVVYTGTNFPETVYVGLSTVAHNNDIADTEHTVTATYANYGPTRWPPSTPSAAGVAVANTNSPGAFPNRQVLAANFEASLPSDGMGYPPDLVQSNQSAPEKIIWNSGGFGSVARDIIADISSQTPGAFSVARYQAGAFDFLLNPREPAAARQHLGDYSNPARVRYSAGGLDVPASQAWIPSPNYGVVLATVRKNGQQWNDTSPYFHAACYVQLDGVATAQGFDMLSGHFRGAQFYTRTTKLVTGTPTDPASDLGNLQRCAIPLAIAWFPYDQGWKAGYVDDAQLDQAAPGTAHWKRGDGWGLNSGTALSGLPVLQGQSLYNSPRIVTWMPDAVGMASGLAKLSFPGVNSLNDGMLFTIGNDEKSSTRGPSVNNAPLADGSGWYVAVRDIETSKADPTLYATSTGGDCGSSFSFLYIPFAADNLVGARVKGSDGSVIKGAGQFTLNRLAAGRYALTLPGKTGTNGVLILQNSGYLAQQPSGKTDVVDTSSLSYEFGGTNNPATAFIIESRYVDPSGGAGEVRLRDADFNFVWVDFQSPLAPPGTAPATPPTLSISLTGADSVQISWTAAAGYKLQSSTSLAPGATWTDLGTQNPQTIQITGTAQYFRAAK